MFNARRCCSWARRWRPRSRWWCLLACSFVVARPLLCVRAQMLFVGAAMAATFLLVPRGFSAGEIDIQSDHMSWNTTKGTYQLNLLARIPVNNPNFLRVRPLPGLYTYPRNVTAPPARAHPRQQPQLPARAPPAWSSHIPPQCNSSTCSRAFPSTTLPSCAWAARLRCCCHLLCAHP